MKKLQKRLWILVIVLAVGYGTSSWLSLVELLQHPPHRQYHNSQTVESSDTATISKLRPTPPPNLGYTTTTATTSRLFKTSMTAALVQNTTMPVISPFPLPRFVLGIFSHDLYQMEKSRRQMIRDTYLQYYSRDDSSIISPTATNNRICALQDVLDGKVSFHSKDDNDSCQLAYTFVTGGATSHNRTELLTATTAREMLLIPQPHQPNEPDLIALDIAENAEYGKSLTWFRYATLLIEEYDRNLPIDYIIKTDSDTLLIPHRFFRWVEEQEQQYQVVLNIQQPQPQRTNVYGGVPMDKTTCGWPDHDHCNLLKAPLYMGGAFYMTSVDVARSVVSPTCPRADLFLPHEDMAMGNYVYHCCLPKGSSPSALSPIIRNFSHPDAYLNTWKHPVKDPKRMKSLWRKFLTKKKNRVKQKKENLSNDATRTQPNDAY